MSDYGLEVYDENGTQVFNSLEDGWLVVKFIDLPANTSYLATFTVADFSGVTSLRGVVFPREFRTVIETGAVSNGTNTSSTEVYGEVASATNNANNTSVTVSSNFSSHDQYCLLLGR
jgi:hypothetical protein